MIFSGFVYLLFFLRFFVMFRFVVDFVAVVECSTFDERKRERTKSLSTGL